MVAYILQYNISYFLSKSDLSFFVNCRTMTSFKKKETFTSTKSDVGLRENRLPILIKTLYVFITYEFVFISQAIQSYACNIFQTFYSTLKWYRQ